MTPPHPLVVAAVSRRDTAIAVALAWGHAAALAMAFVAAGAVIDAVAGKSTSQPAMIAVIASTAIAAALTAVMAVHAGRTQSRAEEHLRGSVIRSVTGGGVSHVGTRSGALVSLATDAVEATARYRATFLGPTFGAFTTPLLVLAILAIAVDAGIAGILAVFLMTAPFVIGIAQRAAGSSGADNRREKERLTADFLQAVQGLGTLVAARAAHRTQRRLAEQGERHRHTLMRVLAANQIVILVMNAAVTMAIPVVAATLAAVHTAGGSLSLGQALSVVLLSVLAVRPVELVGQFFYIGIGGRAAQRAMTVRFAACPPATDADLTTTSPRARVSGLVLENATGGWNEDDPIVRDLSFRVSPGERVALVGPSGVGKSTVSALLQAHLRPTVGRVLVAGEDTSKADGALIRRHLSVVEQRTFLFHESIADNLRVAAPNATTDELWAALSTAGLADEVRAMPAGLNTLVGEHGLTLSGGQSQRLAIARAVLRDSPILILDEPTSQVDLAGEAAFLERLEALAASRTVLMIAHRPGAILSAERTISLTPPDDRGGAARAADTAAVAPTTKDLP